MNLDKILIASTNVALTEQLKNGAMPKGWNGPHKHNMTAARNTSHWTISFLKSYTLTGDVKYKEAAIKSLNFLISSEIFPMNGAFIHRKEKNKTDFNGLIGQSWTLEALIYGSMILKCEKYKEIAIDVFLQHHFDEKKGLWYQMNIDGTKGRIEPTLNQQIWFASIGTMLGKESKQIHKYIQTFMNNLHNNICMNFNGLYPLAIGNHCPYYRQLLKYIYNNIKIQKQSYTTLKEKEYGYHLFTLTGLAKIYEYIPTHFFWESDLFKKSLKLIESKNFYKLLYTNPYALQYNVAGLEIIYIYEIFNNKFSNFMKENVKTLSSIQFKEHYNYKENKLNKNTSDPETLAARIYEIYKIKNYKV